jgi:hypothetical protein
MEIQYITITIILIFLLIMVPIYLRRTKPNPKALPNYQPTKLEVLGDNISTILTEIASNPEDNLTPDRMAVLQLSFEEFKAQLHPKLRAKRQSAREHYIDLIQAFISHLASNIPQTKNNKNNISNIQGSLINILNTN